MSNMRAHDSCGTDGGVLIGTNGKVRLFNKGMHLLVYECSDGSFPLSCELGTGMSISVYLVAGRRTPSSARQYIDSNRDSMMLNIEAVLVRAGYKVTFFTRAGEVAR